jgi:hypothetical protein
MDAVVRINELEARVARLTKAADAMRDQMRFARRFISRWARMHAEGVELFDDACENYDALRSNDRSTPPADEVVIGYWYEGVYQDLSGGRYPAPRP